MSTPASPFPKNPIDLLLLARESVFEAICKVFHKAGRVTHRNVTTAILKSIKKYQFSENVQCELLDIGLGYYCALSLIELSNIRSCDHDANEKGDAFKAPKGKKRKAEEAEANVNEGASDEVSVGVGSGGDQEGE